MQKIYLAIPYSGMELVSFELANQVASELMLKDNIVFSPISHSPPIVVQCGVPGNWDFWKAFDESFISWCDKVVVVKLNGWEHSKGVNAEMAIAQAIGRPVEFYEL